MLIYDPTMPSKAERTRARIIEAARAEFGRRGYAGATVRAIARGADIDPAMVIRYFGNKAGLFAAAAELDLRIPDLRDLDRLRVGEALVAHFLQRWEGDRSDDVLLMLLRMASVEPDAADRLRTLFAKQLVPALAPLVDQADEAEVRVGLVASQMLGLALTRHVLRLPPVAAMSDTEVVARVAPTVQRYLCGALDTS
jgi:AcrR family transcriptional regulator